jgi:uncharacterized protein YkwD
MARPVIENICRRIIPLDGRVVIDGRELERVTEVYARVDRFQTVHPTDPDHFGSGGGWVTFPGRRICRIRADNLYPSGNRLWFQLPNDNCYLTVDNEFTTDTAQVHTYSGLVVTLRNVDGYSNEFPADFRGLTTVPASHCMDPADVNARPVAELEDLMVDMINEIRDWNGVPRVAKNTSLSNVARTHAELMNSGYCYSMLPDCRGTTGWSDGNVSMHRGPDEDSLAARVSSAGFAYGFETCGLNYGFLYPVKGIVEDWDNSPGHRAIMIAPAQDLVGVGIARSEHNGFYYYTATAVYTG